MFEPEFIDSLQNAQVTLVGLGLMGGSLAMRLKADGACRRVTALLRRPEAVAEAESLGVVDSATTDPAAAFAAADVVIFCTPVRILLNQIAEYGLLFKPGAIITDMGSTKQQIVAAMETLPNGVYPIGSHPMCGKEISGLSAADANLYENATWVIAPLGRTPPGVTGLIRSLAESIGARPLILDATQHDTLVATISHMPYLLSAGLVLAAQTVADEDERVWQVAASGFRDTSRIAASNVTMMMDILMTNQTAALAMLNRVQEQLDTLSMALASGDEVHLQAMLEQASCQRQSLYPSQE